MKSQNIVSLVLHLKNEIDLEKQIWKVLLSG